MGSVLKYEESIRIERPVDDVFEYMQDIHREHEWQPNLREAEQIPEGEAGVGTVRRYVSEFMGKRFENVYINTVYEPSQRVAYKTAPESDTHAVGEIVWESDGNATKVTMRVEADVGGLLRFVPNTLILSLARKELLDTLTRLKTLLESSSST